MSVKVIISDILKKRHERVTALEVLRRDLGGLETALENLLGIAGGGGAVSRYFFFINDDVVRI